jgi:hypothetical protein
MHFGVLATQPLANFGAPQLGRSCFSYTMALLI